MSRVLVRCDSMSASICRASWSRSALTSPLRRDPAGSHADVSFRLAPLDRDEAVRQIEETKAYEVLKGVRGAKPCDIDAIAGLIVSAGNMLVEIPEIRELDFNPVMAYPNGCMTVDARIIMGPKYPLDKQ